MNNVVFIGSVQSSKMALETLIAQGVDVKLVCSLSPEASANVSDYYPIHQVAENNAIPYCLFEKISDMQVFDKIKACSPEYIFVIGLSQIIAQDLIDLASQFTVGFHPTALPKYRGRAALPWLILLGETESAVTLFKMDAGMDTGDILVQEPYFLSNSDYAHDVYEKVCVAMQRAITTFVAETRANTLCPKKQNHENASYLLIRRPADGRIDWSQSAEKIHSLIRAASKPYPGAFSFYKKVKVVIWRADIEKNSKYIGINGQIAEITGDNTIKVVIGNSLLVIEEYMLVDSAAPINFRVGEKFL